MAFAPCGRIALWIVRLINNNNDHTMSLTRAVASENHRHRGCVAAQPRGLLYARCPHGKPAGYVEKRSGIVYRYHAADDASRAELAAAALQNALARSAIPAASIDLLISASAIAVQALPCTAAHILKVAGLAPGTPGFDINSSCVSFISALQVAAGLLNAGTYRRIAIVSADLASRGIDWQHEESSLIFGDGAACAIVERGDGTGGILASPVETYPAGSELCEIRAGGTRRNPRAGMCEQDFLFHMQGKPLFRQASALIEGYLDRLLSASGLTSGQIATVVPHRASHLSLEHMRKRLHVSSEALVDIYRHHGNRWRPLSRLRCMPP